MTERKETIVSFQDEPLKIVITHMTDDNRKDSYERGTPGKEGHVKVYFDARDEEEAKKIIAKGIIIAFFGNDMYEEFLKGARPPRADLEVQEYVNRVKTLRK